MHVIGLPTPTADSANTSVTDAGLHISTVCLDLKRSILRAPGHLEPVARFNGVAKLQMVNCTQLNVEIVSLAVGHHAGTSCDDGGILAIRRAGPTDRIGRVGLRIQPPASGRGERAAVGLARAIGYYGGVADATVCIELLPVPPDKGGRSSPIFLSTDRTVS